MLDCINNRSPYEQQLQLSTHYPIELIFHIVPHGATISEIKCLAPQQTQNHHVQNTKVVLLSLNVGPPRPAYAGCMYAARCD